jgi:hypothetical protein
MLAVSPGFLAARLGGTRVKRAYVDTSGAWVEVPLTDHRISATRGDAVVARYSGSVSLAPGVSALIDEHRTRVQVRVGFAVGGVEELVPVGTLVVDDVDETHRGDLVLTGYSAELLVERAALRAPCVVEAGSAIAAILDLLAPVTSSVTVRATRDAQVPGSVFEGSRWAAVRQIAQAADVEAFVGPDGLWCIDDAPGVGAPALTVSGQVAHRIRRTRRGVSNVVVVIGDRAGLDTPPPRGEAFDDNPFSSTYVAGPFGQAVEVVSNPLMTSNDMCRKAAATMLAKRVGRARQVTVESVPCDFLEPGDVIGVQVGGVVETHVIDTVPHAWSGVQVLETRETRTA